MLILISLMPATFAINPHLDTNLVRASAERLEVSIINLQNTNISEDVRLSIKIISENAEKVINDVSKVDITNVEKIALRKEVLKIQKELKALGEKSPEIEALITEDIEILSTVTDYAPWWVIAMISISL